MNVQITHPEIGLPQLTAHLRRAGLSVSQHDLNMTFMYRYLADPEVIARFLHDIAAATGKQTSGMFPDAQIESIGRAMLESCSLSELEAFEKGIDLGLVEMSLETCSRAGIGTFVFVLSHPRQPPESYEQTLQWIENRFETVTQIIAFRFCLARFSRAYSKRGELGLRLKRGASRNLDVFAVPYSAEQEMPLERFMELTARCEQRLRSRQGSAMPVARGSWP